MTLVNYRSCWQNAAVPTLTAFVLSIAKCIMAVLVPRVVVSSPAP